MTGSRKLIRNRQQLIENAQNLKDRAARDLCLALLEVGLRSVLPETIMPAAVELNDQTLCLGDVEIPRTSFERLWVIGLGKASATMAAELEAKLGDMISGGCVVTNAPQELERLECFVSSHPVPDERSVEAANKLMTVARLAGENDLVIVLLSGGGSALAEWPIDGVTLDDFQAVTKAMLKSGMTINEINRVRQSLSRFKAGELARQVYPARMVSLIISDVIGDDLRSIASGPTVPMDKPFAAARDALRRLEGIDRRRLSDAMMRYEAEWHHRTLLRSNDEIARHVHNQLIANNDVALQAMRELLPVHRLTLSGLKPRTTGEARDLAVRLAGEAAAMPPGHVMLMGGESTVTIRGQGEGGRNQELALAAVSTLAQCEQGIALATLATDGWDFGQVAGAVVDSATASRALHMDNNPAAYLRDNNSGAFFRDLEDHLLTGPTGTNVCDLTVVVKL